MYKLADNLLDALTNGEHSKTLREVQPLSMYLHGNYMAMVILTFLWTILT